MYYTTAIHPKKEQRPFMQLYRMPENKRPIATLTFYIREVAYKKTHCITDFLLVSTHAKITLENNKEYKDISHM